jgi:hypothetical protein
MSFAPRIEDRRSELAGLALSTIAYNSALVGDRKRGRLEET